MLPRIAGIVALGGGCGGAPDCVELPEVCTPEYTGTYEAVWANTVQSSCALSGCHGPGASRGGLMLGGDAATSYDVLVGEEWVRAGDASCSPLMVQIATGDMPPGDPLSAAEQCAVQTWIEGGAEP
ncbi:MAG: hypothetical protein KTR31_27685 [Myxococcales bacterium]|nr:hypothetical protein [Myxococcales bacterium]